MKKLKIAIQNSFTALFSLLVTLLLVEVLLQSFPGLLPSNYKYLAHRLYVKNVGDIIESFNQKRIAKNMTAFQQDSLLGWAGKPNIKGTNWSLDGEFFIQTNSEGFRDINHDIVNHEGKKRIAVMGDSFVWGHNLNQSELMPQLLQTELAQKGLDTEVFNFGIGGFGNDQEYLMLDKYILPYKPDIVVLSFFYSNDFWNNYETVSSQKAKPYFKLMDDGSLELQSFSERLFNADSIPATRQKKETLSNRIKQWMTNRSFVYNLVIRNQLIRYVAAKAGLATLETSSGNEKLKNETFEYQKLLTQAIIQQTKQKVEATGARFLVFFYPGYGYYYGERNQYKETVQFFKKELKNIEYLDLTPDFDNQNESLYLFYSEHWNQHGTKAAASYIADYILKHYKEVFSQKADSSTRIN